MKATLTLLSLLIITIASPVFSFMHSTPFNLTERVEENKKAQFPGGAEKMNSWIKENLHYPKNIKRYGTVHIAFTVKKNGKLSNFTVKKGLEEDTNLSAVECLMGMPLWEPAIQNGKKANSTIVLPIRFERK